jgi:CBS domain-containing protein
MRDSSRTARVADIMTRHPTTVSPRTLVHEAEERMEERGIHHLLVMAGEELLGILCSCDLRARPAGDSVAAYMSAPVRTVPDDASIDRAADLMRQQQVGCLVVTWEGGVRGLVTRTDLRRAGVPLERLAQRFCAACRWDHDLVANGADVPFCFDCIERSHPAEEVYDLGCTD